MNFETVYLLFADVKDYSRLTEDQLQNFYDSTVPEIFLLINKHKPFYTNSWGDAFLAVFRDAVNAAECALDLRDQFRNTRWEDRGLPESLGIRIALHSGRTFIFEDSVTKIKSIVGREVTHASRIEPIVPPGEVFTTNLVAQTLEASQGLKRIQCDFLGKYALAKQWGTDEIYRLRRKEDREISTDDLDIPEIINSFNIPAENNDREKRMRELLSMPAKTLSLLALSGFNYLHERGKNWQFGIKKHLDCGNQMKVILLHPESEEAEVRMRAEKR
jgi:class 3 adenylate cyclase